MKKGIFAGCLIALLVLAGCGNRETTGSEKNMKSKSNYPLTIHNYLNP